MDTRFLSCRPVWKTHAAFPKSSRKSHSVYADHQHGDRGALLLSHSRVWIGAENDTAPLSHHFVPAHIPLAGRGFPALAHDTSPSGSAHRLWTRREGSCRRGRRRRPVPVFIR